MQPLYIPHPDHSTASEKGLSPRHIRDRIPPPSAAPLALRPLLVFAWGFGVILEFYKSSSFNENAKSGRNWSTSSCFHIGGWPTVAKTAL